MRSSRVFALQGVFYVLTGLWPIVHPDSFLAVTGGKTDWWLVKTVGLLIAVSGLAFILESRRATDAPLSLSLVAAGQALSLALIDVVYVMKKVILPVYLFDAAAEGVLLFLWATVWFGQKRRLG